MKRIVLLLAAAGTLAGVVAYMAPASGQRNQVAASILETPPRGYRDWTLIAVAREQGKLDDIRAVLGNSLATKAAREGGLSYPDGSIIARVAWAYSPLEESKEAFGHPQSFISGPPKNGVQFMVKDSRKYAATGGWGFAQFNDGKPGTDAAPKACFECHAIVKTRDFVFNRFAP